ncbi:hypothetical protein [Algiphilus sp.]|uniref:hypothetical protein n=1 Tax=Algiphilus sp. TaxID=1872431 RepID=UPI003CCBAF28
MTDSANPILGIASVGGGKVAGKGGGANGIGAPVSANYNGNGHIAGIDPGLLTVDGSPAVRTIRLYDRGPADDMTNLGTGLLVAQTQSAADGTYQFPNLSQSRKFTVVGLDDNGEHNAVIADLIVPVPMPS